MNHFERQANQHLDEKVKQQMQPPETNSNNNNNIIIIFFSLTKYKYIYNLPCVQNHVAQKPPNFSSLIGSVDEDRIDGHRPTRVDLTHHHCVVREEAQLKAIKKKKKIRL